MMKEVHFLLVLFLVPLISCSLNRSAICTNGEASHEVAIYLKLNHLAAAYADELNLNLTGMLPLNEIHFYDDNLPQITLYSAEIVCSMLDVFIEVLDDLVRDLSSCYVILNTGRVVGPFVTWESHENECLAEITSLLANPLRAFRDRSQPVPQWVLNFPDPVVRDLLLDSWTTYGDPFIGFTYRPTIVVAYDPRDTVIGFLPDATFPTTSLVPVTLGLAGSSSHSIVYRDQIVKEYEIRTM